MRLSFGLRLLNFLQFLLRGSMRLNVTLATPIAADATVGAQIGTVTLSDGWQLLPGNQTVTISAPPLSGTARATLADTGVLTLTLANAAWQQLLTNQDLPLLITGAQAERAGQTRSLRITGTLAGATDVQAALLASALPDASYAAGSFVDMATLGAGVPYTVQEAFTVADGLTGERILTFPTATGQIFEAATSDGGLIAAAQTAPGTITLSVVCGGINETRTLTYDPAVHGGFLRLGTVLSTVDGKAYAILTGPGGLIDEAEIDLAGFAAPLIDVFTAFGSLYREMATLVSAISVGFVGTLRVAADGAVSVIATEPGVSGTETLRIIAADALDKAGLQGLIAGLPVASDAPVVVDSLAALIKSGDNGVAATISESACFTDIAGTVPAQVGDPVAFVQDLSGLGNHLTQPDAARRPILRSDANGHYLELDQNTQEFIVPVPFVQGVDNTVVFDYDDVPASGVIVEFGLTGPWIGAFGTPTTSTNLFDGGVAGSALWVNGGQVSLSGLTREAFHTLLTGATRLAFTTRFTTQPTQPQWQHGRYFNGNSFVGFGKVRQVFHVDRALTATEMAFASSAAYGSILEMLISNRTQGVSFALDPADILVFDAPIDPSSVQFTGLTWDGTNAVFAGSGSQTVTMTARDLRGVEVSETATVNVVAIPVLDDAAITAAIGSPSVGDTVTIDLANYTTADAANPVTEYQINAVALPGTSWTVPTGTAGQQAYTVTAVPTAGDPVSVGILVAVAETLAAPTAAGIVPDQTYTQNTGTKTLGIAPYVNGESLTWTLPTAPAGVTINSTTGLVTISTDSLLSAASVVVRATNAAGFVDRGFSVTVNAAVAASTTLLYGRNDGVDMVLEVSRDMPVYYLATSSPPPTDAEIVAAAQQLSIGTNTPNLGNVTHFFAVAQDGNGTSDVVSLPVTIQNGAPPPLVQDNFQSAPLNANFAFGADSGTLDATLNTAKAPIQTTGSTGAMRLDVTGSATANTTAWFRYPISPNEATSAKIRIAWDNTTAGGDTAAGTIEVSQVTAGGARVGSVLASGGPYGGVDAAFDVDIPSFTSEATAAFLEVRFVSARWSRMDIHVHDFEINQGAQGILPTTINLSVNAQLGTAQVLYESDFTDPASVNDWTPLGSTPPIQHSASLNQGNLEWLGANSPGAIWFGDTSASGTNRIGLEFPSYSEQIVELYMHLVAPNNIDGTPYTPSIPRLRLVWIDGQGGETIAETINPVDTGGIIVAMSPQGTVTGRIEPERAGPNAGPIASQKIVLYDITTALPAVQNSGREYGLGPVPLNVGVTQTVDFGHVFPGAESLIVEGSPASYTTSGTEITFTPQAEVTSASKTQFSVRGVARGRPAFKATLPYIIVEDRPPLVISPSFEIVVQEGELLNFAPASLYDKNTGKWPITTEILSVPSWAITTNEGQKVVSFAPFIGQGPQGSIQFRATDADGNQQVRTLPVRIKNFTQASVAGENGLVVFPPAGTYANPTDIREWLETNGLPAGFLPTTPIWVQCSPGYYKTGRWRNFYNLGVNRVTINGAPNYATKFAGKNYVEDACNLEFRNCAWVYEALDFPVNGTLTDRYQPNLESDRPAIPTGWLIVTNPRMSGYTQNDLTLEPVPAGSSGWKMVEINGEVVLTPNNGVPEDERQLYNSPPAGSEYGRAVYFGGVFADGWLQMTGADIRRACVPFRVGGPNISLVDTRVAETRVDIMKCNPHLYGFTVINFTTDADGLGGWFGASWLGPEHNDLWQVQSNDGVRGDAQTLTGIFASSKGRHLVNARQENVHSKGSFDPNEHTRTYARYSARRGNVYVTSGNNAWNGETEQGFMQQIAFLPDPQRLGWSSNENAANSSHSKIDFIDILVNEGSEGIDSVRWPGTRTRVQPLSAFAPTDFFPGYYNDTLPYEDPREALAAGQPLSQARFWADPSAPGNVAHPTLLPQWLKDGIKTYDLGVAA